MEVVDVVVVVDEELVVDDEEVVDEELVVDEEEVVDEELVVDEVVVVPLHVTEVPAAVPTPTQTWFIPDEKEYGEDGLMFRGTVVQAVEV